MRKAGLGLEDRGCPATIKIPSRGLMFRLF